MLDGRTLKQPNFEQVWGQLKEKVDIEAWQQSVDKFNQVCNVAIKYGFGANHLEVHGKFRVTMGTIQLEKNKVTTYSSIQDNYYDMELCIYLKTLICTTYYKKTLRCLIFAVSINMTISRVLIFAGLNLSYPLSYSIIPRYKGVGSV